MIAKKGLVWQGELALRKGKNPPQTYKNRSYGKGVKTLAAAMSEENYPGRPDLILGCSN
jgi:hypothetical protein